jgi:hypothetical protein
MVGLLPKISGYELTMDPLQEIVLNVRLRSPEDNVAIKDSSVDDSGKDV